MCGISGVITFDGEPVDTAVVRRMGETITHRGPDGHGAYVNGGVGLAHRRLSIIDLSDRAAQPLWNETRSVALVYNGEIYNFRELRAELESCGHCFASATDSEVIVHGYEEWGAECVSRLNGMFAFALWDAPRRRLLLARDRYGIKPLYYWQDQSRLVFGSEIKALLAHPQVTASVDGPALLEYFTFQNQFTDRTLFANIRMLQA